MHQVAQESAVYVDSGLAQGRRRPGAHYKNISLCVCSCPTRAPNSSFDPPQRHRVLSPLAGFIKAAHAKQMDLLLGGHLCSCVAKSRRECLVA